ncbi:MAG TPA: menaquinone biosynthesis decarboxylase [bacterium]|nr:menaquinone biosynthesis decarboxylase [bacterium]
MAYSSLTEFVEFLDKKGELLRIPDEVDPVLEITAITDKVSKSYNGGKALLFEKPKGSPYPLLINAFGSRQRMSWALGVEDLEEHAVAIKELLELKPPKGIVEKLKFLPKLGEIAKFPPTEVSKGACQEVVEDQPDLTQLPVLKCWPQDGGRFITFPLVYTQDPETGLRNIGMYRMQVHDARSTGMHWQVHHGGAGHYRKAEKMGKRLEVAVALGGDPALTYAATAPLPEGIDELLFAGFLRKKPVELVKCRTVDLMVHADADFVLEGYVEPGERKTEGPFGDHTGYYSLADPYPVFHVTCITRRKKPIYPTTIVGKPPMEDGWLGKATERLFLPLMQKVLPEVVDYDLPIDGIFHNFAIVSIDKQYPQHARKVMYALWGLGQMMLNKVVVIVDQDTDVHDYGQVLWRVGNCMDPKRDVVITEGPLDVLDHASPMWAWGGKMGIDATKKWKEEGFEREWPEELAMTPEVEQKVLPLLKKYGLIK